MYYMTHRPVPKCNVIGYILLLAHCSFHIYICILEKNKLLPCNVYNILYIVEWSCEVKPSCILLKIKSVKKTMLKPRGAWNNSFLN